MKLEDDTSYSCFLTGAEASEVRGTSCSPPETLGYPYCDKSLYKCRIQKGLSSHCGIAASAEIYFSADPNVLPRCGTNPLR